MAERHEPQEIEKYDEVDKIRQIRSRISELADKLGNGEPIVNYIKENPGTSIALVILLGILAAILSRGFIKIILIFIKVGLKIVTFLYFIRQAGSIFRVFKRKK